MLTPNSTVEGEAVGIRLVRWNLTEQAGHYAEADAIVISVPKCGRTWLRVLLSAYRSHVDGTAFSIGPSEPEGAGHPRVVFTHDLFEHRNKTRWPDRISGKRLVPLRSRRTKRIAMLLRDPRDVAVSLFFQLKKRRGGYRYDPPSIADLIRHRKFGIGAIVDIMNAWIREWEGRPNFAIFRYEDLRADTEKVFSEFLGFVGFCPIDMAAVKHSVDFARFENMRNMESKGDFAAKMLQPRDPDDPDSYKVRRGKVGGFLDYFEPADLEFAKAEMRKLDRRFGYS
jgi:hypothetical protein